MKGCETVYVLLIMFSIAAKRLLSCVGKRIKQCTDIMSLETCINKIEAEMKIFSSPKPVYTPALR